jgi:hypothetical protein
MNTKNSSTGMLRRVALVRTEFHTDDGSTAFLQNVGSYKNHTA